MTRRVIFVSPHTDDAELGCGATLARLIADGWDVMCLALSIAEESAPPDDPYVLSREFENSMAVVGLAQNRFVALRYPVRRFPEFRQDILEELIAVRSDFDPDLVVVPSSRDIHQDHAVVCAEAIRCFKHSSIWGYEHPWNTLESNARRFVEVSDNQMACKLKMLESYASQTALGRPYMTPEYTVSRAANDGHRIGVRYAEVFEAIRDISRLDKGLM